MITFSKGRITYFSFGMVFVMLGFLSKSWYRPWIYSNEINDLGLANSLPSLLYVIGFSLLLMVDQRLRPILVITVVTLGSVLYEFYQFWQKDIFDFSDVIYSFLGGVIAIVVYKLLKIKD